MATQLARIEGAAVALPASPDSGFNLHGLRIFTSIPRHHHGIVALHGAVVVYETDSLCREPVQDGGLYVIEHQRPYAAMSWESWLRLEMDDEDRHRRCQPRGPLHTNREVVQALRCSSGEDRWWLRLASGFRDGPIHSWAIGHNFVGKVAGIYHPQGPEVRQ